MEPLTPLKHLFIELLLPDKFICSTHPSVKHAGIEKELYFHIRIILEFSLAPPLLTLFCRRGLTAFFILVAVIFLLFFSFFFIVAGSIALEYHRRRYRLSFER